MAFYLTDESQFVATFGPSSNYSYKTNSDSNSFMMTDFAAATAPTTTTKTNIPTGDDSPLRARIVQNVKNLGNKSQSEPQRKLEPHEDQEEQYQNHLLVPISGGISFSETFSDAFSYMDSICSGSQSFDEPVAAIIAPVVSPLPASVARETTPPLVSKKVSPTVSPMTPSHRSFLKSKQVHHQQQQINQSRSTSIMMTPTSSSTTSTTTSSSFSPPTFCHEPWSTLQKQMLPSSQQDHVLPKITHAAIPFEKMIAPSSYLYDELLKDVGYRHALQAGTLWQSLCSQHVRFPALWYDGDEPARPPMGCSRKGIAKVHSQWKYYGRHRVQGDLKLNRLIGNRGSSGRLLLHIHVVTSNISSFQDGGAVVADVCVGCFHPNARGVRTQKTYDPALEHCRDVWLGYRKRDIQSKSRIEELLQHYNKGLVDITPLGGAGSKLADRLVIDNHNLKAVFGARSPLFTLFVSDKQLYDILQRNVNARCPASIVLMRHYLQEEEF